MKRFLRIRYILPLVIITALMFTNAPYQWLTARTVEAALIKDKQISTESKTSDGTVVSTYLIYTDQGVYRNDDAVWRLKFDSSDVYGALDVGTRYDLKVYGWRIPILSRYPNIVSIKEVPPAPTQQSTPK